MLDYLACIQIISIHALREEGDGMEVSSPLKTVQFLSTPSARRATSARMMAAVEIPDFYPRPPRGGRLLMAAMDFTIFLFLSTPSARRATGMSRPLRTVCGISIHALREEGDPASTRRTLRPLRISIHALREEGDPEDSGQPFLCA